MGYSVMAYSAQPASVAPAGEAWRSYPDRASLFDADGSHAAAPGNPCQIFFTQPNILCGRDVPHSPDDAGDDLGGCELCG